MLGYGEGGTLANQQNIWGWAFEGEGENVKQAVFSWCRYSFPFSLHQCLQSMVCLGMKKVAFEAVYAVL